ncbi:Dinucleoside triphosphate hydrolase [Mycoemilia scoparia]|uniref:Dinucleoside triphosphate hydrolase n=1 Tax=Mycoemilia scoparia TaxID=417184 RepID=A0A9W8DSP2_9FUNG|nr:Dinucleoside triphosphate hydrolase [Mycoemilia scoparia]
MLDVLIVPNRLTRRFNDLTHEEVTDMFTQGQRVCKALESHYKADAFTMAIQDGPEAGQTVPHVHLHIIPRHKGDYKNNDDIYGDLEDSKPRSVIDNESRPPRSAREMAEEALAMRKLFGQWDTSE